MATPAMLHRALWAILLTLGLLVPQPAAAAHERLRISVSGADFKAYPVAVPDLLLPNRTDTPSQAMAQSLTQLLRDDVEVARAFELVPAKSYIAATGDLAGAPSYSAWAAVGASGLIRGAVAPGPSGAQRSVSLVFYDVGRTKELVRRSCITDMAGASRCVHQFMDAIIQELTGEAGAFSSRIAFVRRVNKTKMIFAADMDGMGLEKMVASGALSLLPAWDSLGRSLFFTSYIGGGTHLYKLSTPTGRIDKVSARPGLNVGAAVSPDGKRVALTLTQDGDSEIYTMDIDGKNLTRLTQSLGQDVSPTWSPDGKRIAFVSSRSGSPHIYVMQADGSSPKRLTYRGTYNQEPDWSPRADGQIAFTARDETLHYDLFLVHPDTSEITRLTQDAADNMSPSFAPDGHHLAFISSRNAGSRQELYVMDLEGRRARRILPGVTDCETPAWGPRLGY